MAKQIEKWPLRHMRGRKFQKGFAKWRGKVMAKSSVISSSMISPLFAY